MKAGQYSPKADYRDKVVARFWRRNQIVQAGKGVTRHADAELCFQVGACPVGDSITTGAGGDNLTQCRTLPEIPGLEPIPGAPRFSMFYS